MKPLFIAIVAAIELGGAASAIAWPYPAFDIHAQAPKGREAGAERGQPPGREFKPERRPEREQPRERLNEDERRALHRDLDKASRELYQRRSQQ